MDANAMQNAFPQQQQQQQLDVAVDAMVQSQAAGDARRRTLIRGFRQASPASRRCLPSSNRSDDARARASHCDGGNLIKARQSAPHYKDSLSARCRPTISSSDERARMLKRNRPREEGPKDDPKSPQVGYYGPRKALQTRMLLIRTRKVVQAAAAQNARREGQGRSKKVAVPAFGKRATASSRQD
jgi:hypothetical protein